jgi:4-alpha-glucanotransferase
VNPSELATLPQLARMEGVQASYTDAAGKPRKVSDQTLRATLAALGNRLENASDLNDALHAARERPWKQVVEPVTVAWVSERTKPVTVVLRLPRGETARVRLKFEDGEEKELRCAPPAVMAREDRVVRQIVLPVLPQGYHQLQVETGSEVFHSLVISAPTHSYSDPSRKRAWGLVLPLYALHSSESWGAGNLGDWEKLSRWVGALGGNVVASLPLLASFLDRPAGAPSPYSPASRLFWNEFYLDVSKVPELAASPAAQRLVQSAAFQRQLKQFRRRREIDYASQVAARREVLEILAREFYSQRSRRRREFQEYLRQRPELESYACFRAVCDQTNSGWPSWPDRQAQGKLGPGDYREDDKRYHLYVQWLAQRQMEELAAACRAAGASFYLDLPLGVHPDGYDVWRYPDLFARGASTGAPPDSFFTKGQDWGFPPLHPRKARERQYGYVIAYLRFHMRHTGLLRIDHVMSLHRLWWAPKGLPPTQGAYVAYPAEELYAILCLESHRHKTALVGENLGTVPPEVNASMNRRQLRQTYVLQYEQRPDPREPVRPPPARCVASLNTHDMPTFQAHWAGADITDRADLGLVRRGEVGKERERRRRLNAALVRFLQRRGWLEAKRLNTRHVLRACLKWLSASSAEVVLINLEDLWLELLPQNVPGTVKERRNWQRKAAFRLEAIQRMPEIRELLRAVNQLRQATPVSAGRHKEK